MLQKTKKQTQSILLCMRTSLECCIYFAVRSLQLAKRVGERDGFSFGQGFILFDIQLSL